MIFILAAYVLGVLFFIHAGLRYRAIEGADALPLKGVFFLAVLWPLLLVSILADGVAEAGARAMRRLW